MKYVLILTVLLGSSVLTNAQSSGGNLSRPNANKPVRQIRGSDQYHGSKDTTPGSPMKTGASGGNEMSGSHARPASASALHAGEASVQSVDRAGSEGSKAAKSGRKQNRSTHKNRRM